MNKPTNIYYICAWNGHRYEMQHEFTDVVSADNTNDAIEKFKLIYKEKLHPNEIDNWHNWQFFTELKFEGVILP